MCKAKVGGSGEIESRARFMPGARRSRLEHQGYALCIGWRKSESFREMRCMEIATALRDAGPCVSKGTLNGSNSHVRESLLHQSTLRISVHYSRLLNEGSQAMAAYDDHLTSLLVVSRC